MVAIGPRSRPPVKETCLGRRGALDADGVRLVDNGCIFLGSPIVLGDMFERDRDLSAGAIGGSTGCSRDIRVAGKWKSSSESKVTDLQIHYHPAAMVQSRSLMYFLVKPSILISADPCRFPIDPLYPKAFR